MTHWKHIVGALLLPGILVGEEFSELVGLAGLAPRLDDQSSMWWAEGFPAVVKGAPWHRVIETGHYAMVLDTEKMTVPHFGALEERVWRDLPPADLALTILVNGKTYTCAGGKGWSRHGGPRLAEAGKFFQRADVTDLIFKSNEGEELSVEARFETAAWPDRLSLILDASPGESAIQKGGASFGKVGGGFGLDGANELPMPKLDEIDPNSVTWSFWSFIPKGYDAFTKAAPWLICEGRNEMVDGNLGVTLTRDRAVATINVGGGRKNRVKVTSEKFRLGEWNHFVISYDGDSLAFFLNGKAAEGGEVGRRRGAESAPVVFGKRGDGAGDGCHFYGVVDEVEVFQGVFSPVQLTRHARPRPIQRWGFLRTGLALEKPPKVAWDNPLLKVQFTRGGESLEVRSKGAKAAVLVIDPVTFQPIKEPSKLTVMAEKCEVEFDQALGWHRIDLDKVGTLGKSKGNNVIERFPLTISNRTGKTQMARLMFSKSGKGFGGRLGSAITGVTAMLCDEFGEPTGIPVQLSKNWHNAAEAGTYKGLWFHGITQLRLAPGQRVKLQLVVANAHWGGVAAASHAQLSLIGWGSNQRWEQSALGCWGESLCYEPAQGQGKSTITDVRPLMVTPKTGRKIWGWTNNVGGGDFFRFFDREGKRCFHQAMQTVTSRQGPCLTGVEYAGKIGTGIQHSIMTSLARTDDLVRGTYRIRMDVSEPVDFSRFVIFQVGSDTYNFTSEQRFVFGDASGVNLERETEPGGDVYRTAPMKMMGEMPWASLEGGRPPQNQKVMGAWANRGVIIREWKARLGGKEAAPHFAERGTTRGPNQYSTVDLVPPVGVTRLEAGDFVEAVIEYIVMPQNAEDYYGPNLALKEALKKDGGTSKMIYREVTKNDRKVEMITGELVGLFPDVRIACEGNKASYELTGGIGYLPLTFTNLSSHEGYTLKVDGKAVDQAVHGKDFWQTDYDPASQTWSRTYNLPRDGEGKVKVEFGN